MTLTLPTELLPASRVSIGVEVECWLQDQTAVTPAQPIVWCPRGHRRGGVQVRNLEQLSVMVSSLPKVGEWAVVEWSVGDVRRWCQTMRYPSGWVVEAHDGTPDDFAKRVYRGAPGSYPRPSGRRHTYDLELWQPSAAADAMWAWLHGSLPEGCSRTMRHMGGRVLD